MGQIKYSWLIVGAVLCLGTFVGVVAHKTYRQTQTKSVVAGLTLEPHRIVFDAVPMGGEATKTFSVTNTSNHPIRILGIQASCGCTRVSFRADLLQPQEQCVVSVSVSGTQRPSEAETAWLQVQTDDPDHARYALPVYVSDVVGARLSPSILDMGVVSAGEGDPLETMRLIGVGKVGGPESEVQLHIEHPALTLSLPRRVEEGIAEFDVQLHSSEYSGGIYSSITASRANGEVIQGTITARIPSTVKFEPESLIFDQSRTGRVLIRLPRGEFLNVSTTSELVSASIVSDTVEGAVAVDVAAMKGLDWGNKSVVRCCLLVHLQSHGTLSIPVTIIPSSQ